MLFVRKNNYVMISVAALAMAALACLSFDVDAQRTDDNVCASMQLMCSSDTCEFPLATEWNGPPEGHPNGTNDYGCSTELLTPTQFSNYPQTWFYFQTTDSGQIKLEYSGTPKEPLGHTVWGPYDTVEEAVSKCDGGLATTDLIDCSSGDCSGTIYVPDTNTGEIYVVMVTNHNSYAQTVKFMEKDNLSTTSTTSPCAAPKSSSPTQTSSVTMIIVIVGCVLTFMSP